MTSVNESTANQLFQDEWKRLTPHERKVIEGALKRIGASPDPNREIAERRTFGERAADAIAGFGGSWTFIFLFLGGLVFWVVLNTDILGPRHDAFDPYPYIFLNLVLSMLAAIQAPVIMMAQNRQAARDRIDAELDHGVNVRAELTIHAVEGHIRDLEARVSEAVAALDREGSRYAQSGERPVPE